MSWTQRFIWVFWIFVISMLLWQAYNYNQKISTPDPQHPTQDHYFFYQPKPGAAAAPFEHAGPYVEQTGFVVEENTPSVSSFTCHVTLKNTGKAKAINVGVEVRPFFGGLATDVDNGGHNMTKTIPDDSPQAQISQWVTFPDLAPGESSTQSAVFIRTDTTAFGENANPRIVYQPEVK